MRAEEQLERVEQVVQECKLHWRAEGIPCEEVAEMESEIEQHLQEAFEDGKTVESVIGCDPGEFAREWAAANRLPESVGQTPEAPWRVALNCLSDTFAVITVLVGLHHLLLWSTGFPVSVEKLLTAIVFTLSFFLFFASSTKLSEAESSTDESFWASFSKWLRVSLYVVLFGSLVAWLALPLSKAALFVWPWQATLVLPVVAAFPRLLNKLIARARGEEK